MGAAPDAPDEDLADEAIDRVAALLASVGIPRTLADLGLPEDRLRWTAEQATGAARLVANNPRPLDVDALEHIVRAAHSGDRAALRDERPARSAAPAVDGGCPVTVLDAALRPVVDALRVPTDLLVGGTWRPGRRRAPPRRHRPGDRRPARPRSPTRARPTRVAAVDAAAAAAAGWAATAPRERSDLLLRAFHLMPRAREELALLISLENGKSLADARGEVGLRRGVLPLVRRGGRAAARAGRHSPPAAPTGSSSATSPSA